MAMSVVHTSISYERTIHNGIRLLSGNTNGNKDVEGFLYFPDFPEGSSCVEETSNYIPHNVTRRADVPDRFDNPSLVALAPWTSPNCVLSLLAAVQNIITAFIFYRPDDSIGMPPSVNDPVWNLSDGGSWKSKNRYPVYAIAGSFGSSIMDQLGLYSGALLDAPNGTVLQDPSDASYNARMYALVELSERTSLPSLWAFLLIVLGIVLSLIGVTSCIMHLYQRRRRNALRQRILNGEVDLERLGIKRLTVPQDAINLLPRLVYRPSEKDLLDRTKDHITAQSDFQGKESGTDKTDPGASAPPPTSTESREAIPPQKANTAPSPISSSNPSPSATTSPPTNQENPRTAYAQPTCPICLDDFIPNTTTVRSLPCQHIYHPECIDPFLLRNSSLCPVCKAKVLPKGYCPATITNAMVRRERQQRRNRDRVRRIRGEEAAAQLPVAALVEPRRNRLLVVQGRMANYQRQFRRAGRSASVSQQNQTTAGPPTTYAAAAAAVEMSNLEREAPARTSAPSAAAAPSLNTPNAVFAPPPSLEQQPGQPSTPTTANMRSERARRRASLFMREQEPTAEDEERERWASLPRWRKAIKSVFPGF
ncbi:MAG: hypothetical protein LQ343_004327 [Gyalolechia ehrenbergii]|nr:MAG: hypothetical protein LQ343_004327 [Gyalolechia ehrenbergii]